jgi:hypothetical protein
MEEPMAQKVIVVQPRLRFTWYVPALPDFQVEG